MHNRIIGAENLNVLLRLFKELNVLQCSSWAMWACFKNVLSLTGFEDICLYKHKTDCLFMFTLKIVTKSQNIVLNDNECNEDIVSMAVLIMRL